MGTLEILNVSEGDVKISFDTNDAPEAIRAKRIIQDMLRRGYALLVEVEGKYQRIRSFDEAKGEYVIADFDAIEALNADMDEADRRLALKREMDDKAADRSQDHMQTPPISKPRRGRPSKRLPMHKTKATAVAPRVGG